jgi:hypothetical protein
VCVEVFAHYYKCTLHILTSFFVFVIIVASCHSILSSPYVSVDSFQVPSCNWELLIKRIGVLPAKYCICLSSGVVTTCCAVWP